MRNPLEWLCVYMRACHRHRPHYILRLSEALVLLYASSLLKFLHLSTGLPYQGLPCSSVPLCQRTMQSASLLNSPMGRPVRDVLVFVGEGQQPNANPSMKPLFQKKYVAIKVFNIHILRTQTE